MTRCPVVDDYLEAEVRRLEREGFGPAAARRQAVPLKDVSPLVDERVRDAVRSLERLGCLHPGAVLMPPRRRPLTAIRNIVRDKIKELTRELKMCRAPRTSPELAELQWFLEGAKRVTHVTSGTVCETCGVRLVVRKTYP